MCTSCDSCGVKSSEIKSGTGIEEKGTKFTLKITDPTGQLARWAIYIQAYEFEIIHRKGIIHSNADTLSRPVLELTVVNKVVVDNEGAKSLDIYEDDALLYRLKQGKHLPGLSS